MTEIQRLERALQIRTALEELMTTEEADKYLEGIDDYFGPYILDLVNAHQATLGSI